MKRSCLCGYEGRSDNLKRHKSQCKSYALIDKQQKYKYKLGVKKSKTISGSTTSGGRRQDKKGKNSEVSGDVQFEGHFPKLSDTKKSSEIPGDENNYNRNVQAISRPAWGAGPGGNSPQKIWMAKKDRDPMLPDSGSISEVSIYYEPEVLRAKAEYKKDKTYSVPSTNDDNADKWWVIKGTGVTEELQELLDYDKRKAALQSSDTSITNTAVNSAFKHATDRDIVNYEREQRRLQHHRNLQAAEDRKRNSLAKELKEEEEKAKELAKEEAKRGMPSARKQNRRPKTSTSKNARRLRAGRPHTAGGKKPKDDSHAFSEDDYTVYMPEFKEYHTKSQKVFLMQECASEWLDKGQKRLNSKIELLQKLIQEKEEKELLKRPM